VGANFFDRAFGCNLWAGSRTESKQLRVSANTVLRNMLKFGAPYGIRTRVTAVRGRCPRPLDEGRNGAWGAAKGANQRGGLYNQERAGGQRKSLLLCTGLDSG
jgi:hypothetical protein